VSEATRYLLDTNVLSDLIRRPRGAIAQRIAAVGETTVATSIIVAAELRYGAQKSGSQELAERINLVLSALSVLPVETPADRHYAKILQHLTRRGTPIGPNDLLIAAHALTLDLTVVTGNEREFARVPGLKVENWLAELKPD
jgi:tRNA(fMet)-specific endonuclease VapC